MRIVLAPMEGVVDHLMRALLTEIGGINQCVTEFVRVSDLLLPPRVFYRLCPELLNQGVTPSGVPVVVQLLGGNPTALAENAARAAELGAPGIDINFGCPAKTVNRHDGGASLLKSPERIFKIVTAVRKAVPKEIPVSAKIRLGFSDTQLLIDNALAIETGGASEITIHGRTKTDGYKPPAYWDLIGNAKQHLRINVIANGEVWSIEDYSRCRTESDCEDVMIGRGMIRYPDLAKRIKLYLKGELPQDAPSQINVFETLLRYYQAAKLENKSHRYLCDRTKQWTSLLGLGNPDALALFHRIKRETDADTIFQALKSA
ncbi:MAG: tRNA-dihydrouridine synthase [Pseudomonadales bacterium]|nr:tRNA-dihydrouridine synthase [Pseudomonadales bacterium]